MIWLPFWSLSVIILSFADWTQGTGGNIKEVTVNCNVTFTMNEELSNYEDISGEPPTFDSEFFEPVNTTVKWNFTTVWNETEKSTALQQASRLCESLVQLMDIGNVSIYTQMEVYNWIFASSKGGKTDMACYIADSPYHCVGMHPSDRNDLALLFNPERIGTNKAARILSTCASSISIVFFALTIVAQLLSREAKKKAPIKILIGLCATVMTAMIIFLAGAHQTENYTVCLAITFILHYIHLAAWCWMCVYSYDIYVSLVKVFTDHKWYLQKISLFVYGTPMIVAGITIAATNTKTANSPDSYRAPNVCWLNNAALWFGFTLPVGIMLTFNLVVLAVVLRELHRMNAKVKTPMMKYTAKQSMLVAITMTTMNGALWVSGLILSITKDPKFKDVLSWTFMISDGFQGVTVFLLTCVRPVATRRAWMRELSKFLCKESRDNKKGPSSRTNTAQTFIQSSSNSPALNRAYMAKSVK